MRLMASHPLTTRAIYAVAILLSAVVTLVGASQGRTQGATQVGGQGGGRGQARGEQPPPPMPVFPAAISADILRGQYGAYRANNDLLYYHLDIRVDPVAKTIGGKNTIR